MNHHHSAGNQVRPIGTGPSSTVAEDLTDLGFEDILKCIHCGLCLDACPTYRSLGVEQDSPRGRLYLMRGLWEGELEPEAEVLAPLDRCLDCRGCQTACPSGVPYGQLLAKTRRALDVHRRESRLVRGLRRLMLGRIFTSTAWLVWLSRAGALFQMTGIPRVLGSRRLARFIPLRLRLSQQLMPAFSGRSFKKGTKGQRQLSTGKAKRGTVALFSGCVMDVAEQQIHDASMRLLKAAGYDVVVPLDQVCCSALQEHAGEHRAAQTLALRNIEALVTGPGTAVADGAGKDSWDAIVVNAAGCSAQLKTYPQQVVGHNEAAQILADKCANLLEWLARDRTWLDQHAWQTEPVTVLYDAPCHLIHAQGIDREPLDLLRAIPGVQVMPIEDYQECCGAAGIYNLVQPHLAADIGGRKIDAIERTLHRQPGARVLVTANPGCLFQIRAGVRARGLPLTVLHPAVFLNQRLLQ